MITVGSMLRILGGPLSTWVLEFESVEGYRRVVRLRVLSGVMLMHNRRRFVVATLAAGWRVCGKGWRRVVRVRVLSIPVSFPSRPRRLLAAYGRFPVSVSSPPDPQSYHLSIYALDRILLRPMPWWVVWLRCRRARGESTRQRSLKVAGS